MNFNFYTARSINLLLLSKTHTEIIIFFQSTLYKSELLLNRKKKNLTPVLFKSLLSLRVYGLQNLKVKIFICYPVSHFFPYFSYFLIVLRKQVCIVHLDTHHSVYCFQWGLVSLLTLLSSITGLLPEPAFTRAVLITTHLFVL